MFFPFQLVLEELIYLFLRDAIKLLINDHIFGSQSWVCELSQSSFPASFLGEPAAHSFFSLLALPHHSFPVYFLSLFPGGTGPTSDTGWGCMLRCGQMIFAQALVCRHLGRGKPVHSPHSLPEPCASMSAALGISAEITRTQLGIAEGSLTFFHSSQLQGC